MRIYQDCALPYIKKGLSAIPDKPGSKLPAIKGWSSYCEKLVTEQDYLEWSNSLGDTNIAIAMGPASGIIALDLDSEDPILLSTIENLLPPSPVERKGSKGWVRFFQYTGEASYALKTANGILLEILSSGKKCTIPPSIHPSGVIYAWSGATLLDVDILTLPKLPPFLISHLESKIRLENPGAMIVGNKIQNGRNDKLSSYCGKLIYENTSVDDAVQKLITFDEETNEIPLFSDEKEMHHTERYTNALNFYTSHLSTINTRRFKKNEAYEIPILESAVNDTYVEEIMGKSEVQMESQESSKSIELPEPTGLLKDIQEHILANSFIKQPVFAFSASLALLSTLISRKLLFETQSPNLYILNISPSGSGKDSPQQRMKDILVRINAEHLMGAGNYVSDASLTDNLAHEPVRLDIIDEAGGLLRTVTSGSDSYNGKMADILAELYTCSNNKYLGRATAEGVKGSCLRPNVIIYSSTTPTGFQESVSHAAIEKGLLGRFLIFEGSGDLPASRVTHINPPSEELLKSLAFWVRFEPPKANVRIGDIDQKVYEVCATDEANKRLNEIFTYFDEQRRDENNKSDPAHPIIARLYQQMVKIVLIHAVSRCGRALPTVDIDDVNFGFATIQYYYSYISYFVSKNIYSSKNERNIEMIKGVIKKGGKKGIPLHTLYLQTKKLTKYERDGILKDLEEMEVISKIRETRNGKQCFIYRLIVD